ncbi:high osmolarity signaling protein SHO1 [Kwoniella sp. DSM 27419]
MFNNGFDPGYIFRHPVFLVTFIVAIPAWIIAFAGQCAAEARYSSGDGRTPVVNTLWFNIWLQLAIIIHLL